MDYGVPCVGSVRAVPVRALRFPRPAQPRTSITEREPDAERADDRTGDPVEQAPGGGAPQTVAQHVCEADQYRRPERSQHDMGTVSLVNGLKRDERHGQRCIACA